jgi:sarcosine oxidase subunit beta
LRRYSAFQILRESLRGHRGWQPAWRSPAPQPEYDVVIVGAGGHGLATAYYLAKRHGLRRVAVLEKGWLGGGNTGRNTTVIRSNYFYPESTALYDLSVRLYEGLSKELNYNVMFSQRGMLILAHSQHDMELAARTVNAMRLSGADAEVLDRDQVRRRAPILDFSRAARYPIEGAVWQARAGTGRHDAVAWGYARAADGLGVDIIQNCEVTGFILEAGTCKGVETTQGPIRAGRTGLAAAGHSSHLAAFAGVTLPLTSYALQAFVTEPFKPVLDTVAFSPAQGAYVSQSDKGGLVFGGGLDRVPSYGQRGNLPMQEEVIGGLLEFVPMAAKAKLVRHWAGIVDVTPDSSPLIGPTSVPGLFVNCGWGTGGFKAIPAGGYLFAHLLAEGAHHPISQPFDLARFAAGRLIDEGAASGIAH